MIGSDQPLGFHSPRREWVRQVQKDRPLGFHSLTGEWDRINYFVNTLVITLNCTIHAYLASGQLIALHCQSHAKQTLQKPPKLTNPRPNLSLGMLERW
jgi:hypothetical protein